MNNTLINYSGLTHFGIDSISFHIEKKNPSGLPFALYKTIFVSIRVSLECHFSVSYLMCPL